MDINQLISIVKSKLCKNILIEDLNVEDKTFLHKNHKNHKDGKFHLKLIIKSKELSKINKIQSSKKIYKILDEELLKYIHSIQILVN